MRTFLWEKICCNVETLCKGKVQNIPTIVLTWNTRCYWILRPESWKLKVKNKSILTFNCQFGWTYVTDTDMAHLVRTIFELRRRRRPQGFLKKEFLTPGYSLKCDVVMCWSNPSRGQHQVVVVREQLHFTEKGFVKNYVLISMNMNKYFMET